MADDARAKLRARLAARKKKREAEASAGAEGETTPAPTAPTAPTAEGADAPKPDRRAQLRARLAAHKKKSEDAPSAEAAAAPTETAADGTAPAAAPAEPLSARERLRLRRAKKAAEGETPADAAAAAPADEAGSSEATTDPPKKLTARERLAARLRKARGDEEGGPSDEKARTTSLIDRHRKAEAEAGPPAEAATTTKAAPDSEALGKQAALERAQAAIAKKEAEDSAADTSEATPATPEADAVEKPRKRARPKEYKRTTRAKNVVRFRPPTDQAAAPVEEELAIAGPPAFPRTHNPYVDDPVYTELPGPFQRLLQLACTEEQGQPVRKVLRNTFGPERVRLEELLLGFIENQEAALRGRFLPDDLDKYIWLDPKEDFVLRYGDGDVKVRATCWTYLFIFRDRRELPRNRLEAILEAMDEIFTFLMEDTAVSPMKLMETISFDAAHGASYIRAGLDLGGWCGMRFESGAVYTDGRVLIAAFQPRVVRGKDVPPKAAVSPKKFVEMLNAARGRRH